MLKFDSITPLLPLLLVIAGLTFSTGGLEPGVLPWLAVAAAILPLASPAPARSRPMAVAALTGVGAVGWFFLTTLPLGPAWTPLLGQPRVEWFGAANQFLQDVAAAAGTPAVPAPPRLSLSSSGTLRLILLVVTGAGCCWATAGLALRQRWRLLVTLVAGAAPLLLLGLIRRETAAAGTAFGDWPWLFSWFDTYKNGASVWPFINRNHFASCAALMAMGALVLAAVPRSGRFTAARRFFPRAAAGLGYMGLGLAVFLSESRGGMIAFAAGSLVVTIGFLAHHRRGGATAAVLLAVCTVVFALALPSETVQRRLDSLRQPLADGSFTTRVDNWRVAAALWRAFPVTGSGMESFRSVFPSFRRSPGRALPFFAENELVQWVTDGGIMGLALGTILAGAWLVAVWRNRPVPPGRSLPGADDAGATGHALRLAALGAFTVVVVHGLTDFPLRIPLNAALAGCLLALGWPAPGEAATPASREGKSCQSSWPLAGRLLTAALFLGLAVATAVRYAPLPQPDPAANDWRALTWGEIQQALALAPTDPGLWREFGARLRPPETAPGAGSAAQPPPPSDNDLSLAAYRQAVARNPADPELWLLVAKLEFASGHPERGAQALERAVTLQPSLSGPAKALLKEVWQAAP